MNPMIAANKFRGFFIVLPWPGGPGRPVGQFPFRRSLHICTQGDNLSLMTVPALCEYLVAVATAIFAHRLWGSCPTQCSVIEHSRVRAGRKMGLKLLFSLPVIPVGSVRRGESLWYPKDMRMPFSFSQTCASVPEITTLE